MAFAFGFYTRRRRLAAWIFAVMLFAYIAGVVFSVWSTVPLRVDFAGGWLDVPRYARKGSYVVNCAITPMVSLCEWPYEKRSGLGGSGAWAMLEGRDPVASELALGVGWQDPAVIAETGPDMYLAASEILQDHGYEHYEISNFARPGQ